ncbi:hypothetical protein B1A99_08725 [Cohnella sp. CIP 111063]|uniref:sugar ABC transporter ATP-binding protein n=1 Tax=unclassified Cohnella TaxID=2636738 RepID=UPI000B8BBA4A|nr:MULTISPECIES: sugar ABC transporter ATP-binding protein [unclassified Cohnella]OXS60495.1 hypothetical protein B1A99_08725 [Cohnella sp. CIP 111063]PRX73202.1 monosaccharide ABC transporter ATP-binding protein (CUT2 family) [Cohnella sp. SGD-V74]
MSEYALRMIEINKTFDTVPVLKNVGLNVRRGEIHALLGENGAGKSTLMNILGGVFPASSGQVEISGKEVALHSPGESQRLGIAFIHQELNVVNDLCVYENLFLGYELTNGYGRIQAKEMIRKCREIFDYMGIHLDPKAMVGELDASYKQIIEIAKALLRNANLIIMDEPTTSLTSAEIGHVFAIMRTLKEKGASIIFISHKLGEVVEICDRYTVLRNGEKIVEDDIRKPEGSATPEMLARHMVGRDVLSVEVYEPHPIGGVLLEVDNLSVRGSLKNISFQLNRGEILGFTGLLGDGRTELARALFGDLGIDSGTIKVKGNKIVNKSPEQAKTRRFGYVPDNRKENGIVQDLTVTENITLSTLGSFRKLAGLDKKKELAVAAEYVDALKIKAPALHSPITSLSGGNQQKAVLAKWLHTRPEIMIFANPTQGVDVGAKNEIYAQIMELAKNGVGVIVMSGEAHEVQNICDRVCVMYHGEIKGELTRGECSEESLMILSTGGSLNSAKGGCA